MAKHGIVKFSYTPILGWSFSRYSMFQSCKRQYWFNYYGKFDREIPLDRISFLKGLTSKNLEVGTIVHYIIAEALKFSANRGVLPTYEQMLSKIEREEKALFAKDFFEVYYREANEIPKDEIVEKVKLALSNVCDSGKLDWIFAKSDKSNWFIEPAGFGETRVGEKKLKAYCKVDFLFPVDGKLYIFDWKTGKPKDSHLHQLIGYSNWASYHLDRTIGEIQTTVAYLLPEYSEKTVDFDETAINGFPLQVERETNEMYQYLEDIGNNKPKSKDNFLMTENHRTCRFCNYKELCKKDALTSSEPEEEF